LPASKTDFQPAPAAHSPLRGRLTIFFFFCTAWWLAFAAIYGWWGYLLYQHTGNPIFPMYNNLFRSDWLSATALPGSWFIPQTIKEAVFFPFSWVNSNAISASTGTDLRFGFAYLAIVVTAIFWTLKKMATAFLPSPPTAAPPPHAYFFPSRIAKSLLVFILLSFLLWEPLFSVLRYAIPIEVLLGGVIFICAKSILNSFKIRDAILHNILLASLFLTLTIVALGTTKYPSWGRLKSYNTAVFEVPALTLQENTLVFLYTPETQFLAPFIAKKNPTTTFTSPGDDPLFLLEAMTNSGLHKRVVERTRNHAGPVGVLIRPGFDTQHLPAFGLSIDDNLYETIETNQGMFRFYFARNAASTPEKNNASKEFFIKNTLTHFSTRITATDTPCFAFGWGAKDVNSLRPSNEKKSSIEFFLPPDAARKSVGIKLSGKPIGTQRAIIKLNGALLFSGTLSAPTTTTTSDKAAENVSEFYFPLPPNSPGLLRDVSQGANLLEFTWADARAADDRPWPLVRRPRSGKLPPLAFQFHLLELTETPNTPLR
jgi:hypothetical protein